MRRPMHLVRACAISFVALCVSSALLLPTAHAGQRATKGAADDPEALFVTASDSGVLSLQSYAPPPLGAPAFKHFGFYSSSTQTFSKPFQTLQLDYISAGAGLVLVDLRASLDGMRWSEWETDRVAGEHVTFGLPARFAQYRVKLFGNGGSLSVRAVALSPVGGVDFAAMDAPPVAPTYKVHATRMGMVGGRTANGHIIKERDHYVSLPSWRSLSKKGRGEYFVRVTYNGRSSVAPVYDVGPWNERDDYWNAEREIYKDLPRGYPQDHAAYFDGYNKGRAEKGKVSFPTAIDIGDGVWWDDLKIKGDRAVLEVTFLWLGTDPLEGQAPPPPPAPTEAPAPAAPPPAPPAPTEAPPAPTAAPAPTEAPPAPTAAPQPTPQPPVAPTAEPAPPAPAEATVDNQNPGFKKLQAKVWYDAPKGCSSGHAHWTYTTPDPQQGENTARWQPSLAAEALYDVLVYIPNCAAKKARTTSAHYIVKHRDGQAEIVVNQEANGGQWVSLGRYPFAAGEGAYVELRDVTDDSMQVLWYDSVKWVPAK